MTGFSVDPWLRATILGAYFACLGVMSVYGLHRWHLLVVYLRHRGAGSRPQASFAEAPRLTIQLPLYNELHVAERLIAEFKAGQGESTYDGRGFCYIEFGAGRVGSVEVQFLSGQPPSGKYYGASVALAAEKKEFGSTRRARWFGL